MPVTDLHHQVAAIALKAASGHGFALAGGNALLAHGIITRPTEDVDLFTNDQHGVEHVAAAVQAAVTEAGYQVNTRDQADDLADIFPEMGQGLAEWLITAPDGQQLILQLAYFTRCHSPVTMDMGPVLDLEDVAAGKICALASRIEPRDYIDTAAMLTRYTPDQLISLARQLDPGLEHRDFAEAGQRLDHMPDTAFTALGITARDITTLRDQFADWPRA
jgi:predicted nucleotidyltransferase component of viral defense system